VSGPAVVRTFEVASVSNLNPRVLVETSLGDITIQLEGEAAPRHTANFLLYVDDGFFDGLLFHRAVCTPGATPEECEPFVIQTGGFERIGDEIVEREPTRDSVDSESESGLTNGAMYSVSLALAGGDPNSGTTQFFVNLDVDNAFLDDQGFTAFGQVVAGTDVVDAISAVETTTNDLLGGEPSLPVEDIVLIRASRLNP
jgi:cyclophilin family peptidyl-prolyl cis-trans isomerase